MDAFFLTCALIGGGILVLQLLLSVLGFEFGAGDVPHDLGHDAPGSADASDGLNLLSVRAVAAGVAFFGLAGWGASTAGWHVTIALALAAVVGVSAMMAVAAVMRWLLRLEDDGTVRIEGAVGQPATVYVPIPGEHAGAGKVTLALQGRTVEYQAVTPHGPLATGTLVTVVDVRGPDVLEVVPTPTIPEVR